MKNKPIYSIAIRILIILVIVTPFILSIPSYCKQNSHDKALTKLCHGDIANIFYHDIVNDELEFIVIKQKNTLDLIKLYKDDTEFWEYKKIYSLDNKDDILNWIEQTSLRNSDKIYLQKIHYIVGNGAYDEIDICWDKLPKGVSVSFYQVDNFYVVKLMYTELEFLNTDWITDYKWLENVSIFYEAETTTFETEN